MSKRRSARVKSCGGSQLQIFLEGHRPSPFRPNLPFRLSFFGFFGFSFGDEADQKVRQSSIDVYDHAGAAPHGQSVPCAGVSAMTWMLGREG